jgi:hypothetical protein
MLLLSGLAAAGSAKAAGQPQFAPNPGSSGRDRSVQQTNPQFAPNHPSGTDSDLGNGLAAEPTAPASVPAPSAPETIPLRTGERTARPTAAGTAARPPKTKALKPAARHPAQTQPNPHPRHVTQRVSAVSLPRKHAQASSLPPLDHAGSNSLPWVILALGLLGSTGLITIVMRRRMSGTDLAGALAAYRRADERGDANGSFNLGCLLAERGDTTGAVAALRRADERGDAAGASNLGVLMEQQGDFDAAHAAYRRADERGYAHGSFNLGLLLERRGDLAGAEEAYRRAARRGDAEVARRARAALAELCETAAG